MATAPSATPHAPKRGGPGCLFVAIALPLVILVGVVIGTALDTPEEPPEEVRKSVTEGTAGTSEWELQAVRDIEGELCAFLLADDVEVTGGCGEAADDYTFDDGTTVVFGYIEGDSASVRVVLDDADVLEIHTVAVDGFPGRWFADSVPRDVDVEKLEVD